MLLRWPSLQALRAETMVDGLPRAFKCMRGEVVIRDLFWIPGTDLDERLSKHASDYGGSNSLYERF